MKKKLKKVTALALAALTVTSMSSVAFAGQGDVDGDDFVTANDAALVNLKVNNLADKLSAATQKRINVDGKVTLQSILSGHLSATDASKILEVVNKGGSFDAAVQAELKEVVAAVAAGDTTPQTEALKDYISLDGDDVVVSVAEVDPETGEAVAEKDPETGETKTKKAKKKVNKNAAATTGFDKLVEEIKEEAKVTEEVATAVAIIFAYGDSEVRVEATDADNILDRLDVALKAQNSLIIQKAVGLTANLKAFSVNGVKIDKAGWAKIGAVIAADQDAFNALYPENADEAYVAAFVSNLKKAFPASYKATALKNVEDFRNTKYHESDLLTLTIDGNTTQNMDAVLEYVDKFLYADGTPDGYNFSELTLDFGGKDVLKVTKTKA